MRKVTAKAGALSGLGCCFGGPSFAGLEVVACGLADTHSFECPSAHFARAARSVLLSAVRFGECAHLFLLCPLIEVLLGSYLCLVCGSSACCLTRRRAAIQCRSYLLLRLLFCIG